MSEHMHAKKYRHTCAGVQIHARAELQDLYDLKVSRIWIIHVSIQVHKIA